MPTGLNFGTQQTCTLPLIVKMEARSMQELATGAQRPVGAWQQGIKKKEPDFWKVQGQVLLTGCRCFWILLHLPPSIHPEHHPNINEAESCPAEQAPCWLALRHARCSRLQRWVCKLGPQGTVLWGPPLGRPARSIQVSHSWSHCVTSNACC